MFNYVWRRFVGQLVRSARIQAVGHRRTRRAYRLALEQVEDRIVPTTDTWTASVGGSWDVAGNWSNGVPTSSEDVSISLSSAGTISVSGAADAALSVTTNSHVTLEIKGNGSLTLGKGNSTFSGPLTVDQSGTLDVGAGSTVLIAIGETVNVSGKLSVNSSTVQTGGNNYGATQGITVEAGGEMSVTGSNFAQAPGTVFEGSSIQVDGTLSASGSTFQWNVLSLANGSDLGANENNSFETTLYVPVVDVPLLTDNPLFETVCLNSEGSFGTSSVLDLVALGSMSTDQTYVFYGSTAYTGGTSAPFSIPAGETLNFDSGVTVRISVGAWVDVSGALNVDSGATVQTGGNSYGATQGITVEGGGDMSVTDSNFTQAAGTVFEGSSIQVDADCTLSASGSSFQWNVLSLADGSNLGANENNSFETTLYVPVMDVPLLTDNPLFEAVCLNSESAFGNSLLNLVPLGTDSSDQTYVFYGSTAYTGGTSAPFSIPAGETLNVDSGVTVTISVGAWVDVSGALNIDSGATVQTGGNSYGATQGIMAEGGGDVSVTDSNFTQAPGTVFEGSSIKVDSNGNLNIVGGTFEWNNLYVNAGSTAVMQYMYLASQLDVNSSATITIDQNDFTTGTIVASGASGSSIDLTSNYWGTTNSSQIESRITDSHSNSNLPTVDFEPVLASRPVEPEEAPVPAVGYTESSQTVSLAATFYSPSGTINEGTADFTILQGSTPIGSPVDNVSVTAGAATATYTIPAEAPAGTYTIDVQYNGDSNFEEASDTSQSLTVTPAPLTVTGMVANSRAYNATTTATLDTGGASLVGVYPGDSVTLDATGASAAFADKDVGPGIPVTVAGLTLAGPQAADYVLTQPTLSANITPFEGLTVSGITGNKVYDGTTIAAINPSATLQGVFLGDDVALETTGATGAFASPSVGNGIEVTVQGLALSGAQADDYSLTQLTTTADITPLGITVTGVTADNKVYDQSTAATLNTTGASLVGVLSGDTVALSSFGATSTFASQNVGTGIPVTASGLSLIGPQAPDYTLTQPTTITANITPASVTVTGITNNKVYDDSTAAVLNAGASLVGVYSGDTVDLSIVGATGTFASKDVGDGIPVSVSGLKLTGAQAGDYTLTQLTPTADITPATLTVVGLTANNKTYDQSTAASLSFGSANLSGVYNGDTVTLDSSEATGTFAIPDVGNGISIAVAGLMIGGAQSGDYTLTQPTTSADILPITLTVNGITANDKVYDGAPHATLNTAGASLSAGVLSGDEVTLSTSGATGAFSSKDVGGGISVTVAGLTIEGTQAENYTLTQPTTTADITPAGLTVVGITADNRIYDSTTNAELNTSAAALVGVVPGDAVTLSTGGATGTFASKDVGNGIPVAVAGLTIGGAQADNYSLTQPTSSSDITPATLTVTAITASNKDYDGTTAATLNTGNATLNGVFPGDVVTLSTAGATGTFATAAVGSAIPVAVTGLTIAGPQAADYSLTQPAASANITPGPISATTSVVTLSSANVTAGNTITVTLYGKDAYGNALTTGGADIVLELGAGSGQGAFGTVTDNGDGTYTAIFTGTTAGTNTIAATVNGMQIGTTPPPVTVTAGAFSLSHSRASLATESVSAGSVDDLTIELADGYGNPIAGGFTGSLSLGSLGGGQGTFGALTSDGDGKFTVPFTGSVAGDNTIVVAFGGQTLAPVPVTVSPGPASLENSTVAFTVPVVQLGGETTVVLQAVDAYGNPLTTGGLNVAFFLDGAGTLGPVVDRDNGTYTATVTGTADGSISASADIGGNPVSLPVPPTLFVSGNAISAAKSKLSLSVTTVTAGDEIAVVFQAEDAKGDPEAAGGLVVTFELTSSKGGKGTFAPAIDNGNGTYTAVFTGTTAGSNTITASIADVSGTPKGVAVKVTAGMWSPATSKVTVSPTSVKAGGKVTVTLQLEDAYGNKVTSPGLQVAFTQGGAGGGTLSPAKYNANGTYTATFLATKAGAVSFGATMAGSAVTSPPATLTVIPGAASAAMSTLTLSATSVAVGGAISITLQAVDAYGNDETTGGLKVAFRLGSTKGGQGAFGKVVDNHNGTYTVMFTGTMAGTNTIEATIGGVKLKAADTITVG